MNDPRITAYALGELTGNERDQFERELAGSEDLQRELNETIKIADALGQLPMPTESLSDQERAALREECTGNLQKNERKLPFRRIIIDLAAVAAIIAFFAWLSRPAITGALVKADPARIAELRAASERGQAQLSAEPKTHLAAPPASVIVKREPAASVKADALPPPEEAPKAQETAMLKDVLAQAQTSNERFRGAELKSGSALSGNKELEATVTGDSQPVPSAPSVLTLADADGSGPARTRSQTASGNVSIVQRSKNLAANEKVPITGALPAQGRLLDDQAPAALQSKAREFNTEAYDVIQENVFRAAKENPLSTFSIDVDTASYANVRRFLQNDQVPPAGAIRTEELINYFRYEYPQPSGESPFSVSLEASKAPWDAKRILVRIGLKGRETPEDERGPANLVFLIDVSGSMDEPDKLPLLKRSLSALVENLSPKDRVAIVVYAGSSGLVLPSTLGREKSRILQALDDLKAGGSTNGGEGVRLAYKIAGENFLKGGNNRVILCTDGDFNVGTTSQSELVRLIEKERASGVFLSVLGFGTGNLKDSTMEKLADKGNGNYSYIDSLTEGRKVLVEEMGAILFTIAKDVKIQVEFNPARVAGYRLIGYENRLLAKEDFNDDKKDAGEIGAGHTVTALYEIIPAGQPLPDQPSVDPLKYQKPEASVAAATAETGSSELLTVKLRYKAPDGDKSRLLEVPLAAPEIPAFEKASSDFQFAAGVAAFGMKLRGSPTAGDIGWSDIQKIVRRNLGEDPGSYRAEFLTLIERAARLTSQGKASEE